MITYSSLTSVGLTKTRPNNQGFEVRMMFLSHASGKTDQARHKIYYKLLSNTKV